MNKNMKLTTDNPYGETSFLVERNAGYIPIWNDGNTVTVAIAPSNDDAARIVSCVNALTGIDDPQAFVDRARALEEEVAQLRLDMHELRGVRRDPSGPSKQYIDRFYFPFGRVR